MFAEPRRIAFVIEMIVEGRQRNAGHADATYFAPAVHQPVAGLTGAECPEKPRGAGVSARRRVLPHQWTANSERDHAPMDKRIGGQHREAPAARPAVPTVRPRPEP